MRSTLLASILLLAWVTRAGAAPLIVAKNDKHGQPLATWKDPPVAAWNGQADLPEGEYTLAGVKTDRLVLPMRGRIVIRDGTFKRIERFSNEEGDLEVVIVGCTFTEQFAIHMPASCSAVALVNCKFILPDGPRMSYVYISTRGPNYIDGLVCSGGFTKDNGQHAVDVGTEDGELISIRGLVTGGGSTSGVNVHVKPKGLQTLWLSDSLIRDRTGIDCADVDNSKKVRTKAIKARNVEFALQQHPTQPASMYVLFPAHAVDEFHGLGGVTWTAKAGAGWPTDAEYGSQVPKIVGTLPWGEDGRKRR